MSRCHLLSLALLLVVVVGSTATAEDVKKKAPEPTAPVRQVEGTLTEARCYFMTGAVGGKHQHCAFMSLKANLPVGILTAFLGESLLLGLLGGIVGLVAASFMQALSISTTNFQTFAELTFSFTLTPSIIVASLGFALAMGFVGGFLPAARAARMKIVDALRAA